MMATRKPIAGKYDVVRRVGEGSYGVVYEAVHTELGRTVAIKRLHLHHAVGEPLERFKREARICAQLDNPHIVGVHDFGEDEKGPFLVMDLLRGRTMQDWITNEPNRPTETIALVARQVLSALAAAHRAGVVHRDIKPANVILVDSPLGVVVKVLDFGIAKLREAAPLTRAGDMVGTITYMSPEQALAIDVDARSDIYAVGICMYIALTDCRPFTGSTVQETLSAIETGSCKEITLYRRDLPAGLAEVVHRAFALRPEQRFQTAEEMIDALAPYTAVPAPRSDGVSAVSSRSAVQPVTSRTVASHTGPLPSASNRGLVIGIVIAAVVTLGLIAVVVVTLSD